MKNLSFPFVSSRKLTRPFVGPFKVIERLPSGVSYRLDLPSTMKCHNVFHVERLFAYVPPLHEHQAVVNPDPVLVDHVLGDTYEVGCLLDRRWFGRGRSRRLQYLVRWAGYGAEHDTWKDVSSLASCRRLVLEYDKRFPMSTVRRGRSRRL